jgi:CRP-like cAMP-binding protein
MRGKDVQSVLADFPFTHVLTAAQVDVLAMGAQPFTLSPGTVLAREGHSDVSFNLITAGCVTLSAPHTRGGPVIVQRVGPGEVVGWSWLVPPHVCQFDIKAQDEARGYSFEGSWLRELCARDVSLGRSLWEYLATVLASRLAATRRTHAGCVW